MQRDPRTYLWDARQAAERVVEFVAARTWSDYEADALIRSAVERQFEIIGEASTRCTKPLRRSPPRSRICRALSRSALC
jgi:uncharacterized protein with HEPN domain